MATKINYKKEKLDVNKEQSIINQLQKAILKIKNKNNVNDVDMVNYLENLSLNIADWFYEENQF